MPPKKQLFIGDGASSLLEDSLVAAVDDGTRTQISLLNRVAPPSVPLALQ